MKFDLKKFIEDSGLIKMTPEEESQVFDYLQKLMIKEPAPVSRGRLAGHTVWSSNYKFNPLLIFTKPMPVFITLMLLIGGGASFAAEKSLPGEILYPIKVSVNENVRAWTALSAESKISLDSKLAERRLEEAERLAAKNELGDEVRAEIEENFEIHATKVEDRIAKLSDVSEAVKANSNFHTSLEAHAKILDNIKLSSEKDVELNLIKLSTKVKNKKGNIKEDKEKQEDLLRAEAQASVKIAAEGKFKSASNKIEEVKKFVASKKNQKLDARTKAKIDLRLKLAEDTLVEGQVKFEAKAYSEAFLPFQKAHDIAQEIKLLVKAKVEFENSPSPTPSPFITQSVNPSPTASSSPTPSPTRTPKQDKESDDDKLEIESEIKSDSNSYKGSGRIKIDLDFD